MWDTIKIFFKGTSTPRNVIIHALIVLGFLLPIRITAHYLEVRAQKFIDQWNADLQPITCMGDGKIDLPGTAQASDEEIKRLVGQFQETQGRMKFHFDILATFYRNYFTTIILTGVLASLAAIALLFITSDGWQHSSPYARTIFLVATVSATYCAAFPSILQQQQNIDDNKKLYLEYVALTNEMCSYAATTQSIDKNDEDAKTFIHDVDTRLERLNKIAIGFDVSKSPDFEEALRKGIGTGREPRGEGLPRTKNPAPARSK
jgi:hypothetical protein